MYYWAVSRNERIEVAKENLNTSQHRDLEAGSGYEYDGKWEHWCAYAWGKSPTEGTMHSGFNTPEAINIRKRAWHRWSEKRQAIRASEKRAVDVLKTWGSSFSVSVLEDIKRLQDQTVIKREWFPKESTKSLYDRVSFKDLYMVDPNPEFAGKAWDWYGMAVVDDCGSQTTTKKQAQKLNMKTRKAVPKVAKKTANDIASEHASEAQDQISDAQDFLKAADAFTGKRVHDVVIDEGWGSQTRVTFILEKIDMDVDQGRVDESIDKALTASFVGNMWNLGQTVQSQLQIAGRSMLKNAALSMHRLARPEMDKLAAQLKEANADGAGAGMSAREAFERKTEALNTSPRAG